MLKIDYDLEDFIDNNTDNICNYCHNNIIDDIPKGINWLCEGSYCECATEGYLNDNEDKIKQYIRLLKLKKINNVGSKG